MDPLHELATRIGLAATDRFGFALAGGYAVQAHGFLTRRSEDVDLFTSVGGEFEAAVVAAVAAYRDAGLKVEITLENPGFARLLVTDGDSHSVKIEMGVDWRAHPPVRLEIGPVLHPDDAVGNKVAALYGRAEVRDFVDVFAVLRSGRYDSDQLIDLATCADPGFDTDMFATALSALGRIPDQALSLHGLSDEEVQELRRCFHGWERSLRSSGG
ncbi:Nucleotidyl transferase AbiEii toxin, Type IV TA system [Streptosporangium canum]|uniref:Nucleotidyl transferase AbiEii toxin, Type IV TA system n=1 Tax=Streptosporangium canum TaxID=324952 RepID=A0A1I3LJW7_9ACTN|nr:nucleotidyl transferase AbiEii/AbiGii toxin family protein [Streptosporangium canum]SFI84755.1 Nucleotidyl transferase AbiEii toxin, Type IV TA system [Streptosporangium canum]